MQIADPTKLAHGTDPTGRSRPASRVAA